ncbi:hypothetical protein GP486_002733 [Trichoglossum hirsutum]|uniref:Calcineurin-like phosphoesterase domain-containing protein n=1 Tax=Trichoglossum hirsutum TaxID=265104 RepID=A0A9P8LEI6_9PEZI|nr:hypothetical protein GP486_002733 [Trichoglossum hirsutum]
MKEKADGSGVDLLLIDTGDRIEGNGLYGGSNPVGEYTSEIFKQQEIDVICSGNHELYKKSSADREYLTTVPNFKDSYLASNLDYIDSSTGKTVPLAPRFRKFTTKNQGIRIVAFGFLFDFTGNYNNTIIQEVEKTVTETWFQEAIRDKDVDLFLVIGHVPVRSEEYTTIHKAIRAVNWDTPIQFFGGHTHIRDYKIYDSKTVALEGGRFMETIGFMSIEGLSTSKAPTKRTAGLKFDRMYIDNNLYSFHHHTNLNDSTFPTTHGRTVSEYITHARKTLKLDSVHGCAPQDFWLSRARYGSRDSIYTWLQDSVLPEAVVSKERKDKPRLIIVNTGAIRYDIFKGPFTRDTTFIVSPFTNEFHYIRDVPYTVANKVALLINNEGDILVDAEPTMQVSSLRPPEQTSITKAVTVEEMPLLDYDERVHSDQVRFGQHHGQDGGEPGLTPGYTTTDDLGDDGDDTVHTVMSNYRVPNCMLANASFPHSGAPEQVDLVFMDFIEPYILLALSFLGQEYTSEDARNYMGDETLGTVITQWVEQNWDHDC